MSLLLTVYDTPAWKTFADASGIHKIATPLVSDSPELALMEPSLTVTQLSQHLSTLKDKQSLFVAVVQLEHFIANELDHGNTLVEAAECWKKNTAALLDLHRQQRKKLHLFNLHHALRYPAQFRQLIGNPSNFNDYPAHDEKSTFALMAACQFAAQAPELSAINTRLQASCLFLCESESITLNIELILREKHAAAARLEELQFEQQQAAAILKSHSDEGRLFSVQTSLLQEQLEENQSTIDRLQSANCELEKTVALELEENLRLNEKIRTYESDVQSFHETLNLVTHHLGLNQLNRASYKNALDNVSKENFVLASDLNQLVTQLELTLNQHQSEVKTVTDERDLVIIQLGHVQEELENYYVKLQNEQQSNKHALLARDKQQAKELSKLETDLRKYKARAASAEYKNQCLEQELFQLRNSLSWKSAKPIRAVGRLFKKQNQARDELLQQTALILTSEFFDVDWYLSAYPDVAESGMNPAEHYLLFGANEGRLPSPHFDGNWYLQQYPDIAQAKLNPLLHFVKFGRQEGRRSSPKLLTQDKEI